MNTGVVSTGTVVQRTAERQQPVILLIEQANGWRCFRFEERSDRIGTRAFPGRIGVCVGNLTKPT